MECNDINYEGKATRINRHPHEPIIAYPSGSSIIICSVMDPSDSFVYKGHSAPTTIAKFSPNGSWIASGDSSGFVRIWSWSDGDHLTKMATKLFSGPVNHIDWNAESRILLVLGDDGTSQQTTKSMNFDTTVYTTPTSSLQPDRQNSFLSSLSPREKLSVSVRSGTSPVRMEPDGQMFSPHSVQSGSIAVTSVVASTYFHQSDHTSHATGTSASKSTMLNIQHATPKLCSPANSQSKGHFTPRAGHLTPRSSSNSVLDRLRYLEETMPLQNQHNSVTEGCIADLDKRIAHIDASIASAVNVVQIKFDRELETIRREHENRNAFQSDENIRLQQQMATLTRDNHHLKRKLDVLSVQLEETRQLLGDSCENE